MATMKKKKLNENTEVVAEDGGTAAAASLHPAAKPNDDPKAWNKSGLLAKMIGASHAMTSDELLKHFNGMMEWQKKAGHGPGVGDVSGSNKATQNMHPSAASHVASNVKEAIKADVESLLSEQDGLSDEFKGKAATLFEAALEARVAAELVRLDEEFQTSLNEAIEEVTISLKDDLDKYLGYVADEWMEENTLAVETGLRNEMTNDFITGLRSLFLEHNINIPEGQDDVVDTMAEQIATLESQLNDLISENSELKDLVSEATKKEAVDKICEGMTLVESEKLRELAANVDADDLEEYTKKITVIKESALVKGASAKKSTINESLEQVDPDNAPEPEVSYPSPAMARYARAISRTVKPI